LNLAAVRMFKRILVAYGESPESGRALLTGIHLAKHQRRIEGSIGSGEPCLRTLDTIDAEVAGGTPLLRQQASDYHRDLQLRAQQGVRHKGVILTNELVEALKCRQPWNAVQRIQNDLLAVGLRRHSLLFSRLWNRTAHDLSQQVMGMHSGGALNRERKRICLQLACDTIDLHC
jgi:Universal stress protein family